MSDHSQKNANSKEGDFQVIRLTPKTLPPLPTSSKRRPAHYRSILELVLRQVQDSDRGKSSGGISGDTVTEERWTLLAPFFICSDDLHLQPSKLMVSIDTHHQREGEVVEFLSLWWLGWTCDEEGGNWPIEVQNDFSWLKLRLCYKNEEVRFSLLDQASF